MTASWASSALCGRPLWEILVISPEVLVFAFFMLSDPKTVPVSPLYRVLFGLAVGIFSAVLLGPTVTEFWTKTAILAGLVVACAIRFPLARLTRLHWAVRVPAAALAGLLCLASLPLSTAVPARKPQLVAWLPGELAAVPANAQVGAGPGIGAAAARAATDALPAANQASSAPLAGSASDYVWGVPKLAAVVVPKNVSDFNPGLTPRMASAMAYNLAVDLNIEAEARRLQSPDLAATAASGDGLAPFTSAINSDRSAGQVVTTSYSFSRGELTLLLPKFRTQASRLIGTTLIGTAHVTTYDTAGQQLSQKDLPYTRIWELTPSGGLYQITNEYTGLAPAP